MINVRVELCEGPPDAVVDAVTVTVLVPVGVTGPVGVVA
jgi:hypothetical protein